MTTSNTFAENPNFPLDGYEKVDQIVRKQQKKVESENV